ncbi:MAG: F0F1 ATP synthase subunit B [Phycisphaerales bacterium]|nr:F0F1 ATP synthase subunit B [Phycisphaerales bacterium]
MRWVVFAILAVLTFRAPTFAQEHGGTAHPTDAAGDAHDVAGHGPKYELLTVDGGTAVWTIVIFLILLVVLRAAAWKPIQKVLVEREKFIADSLAQAKHEREEAKGLLVKYQGQLDQARQAASGIVDEGRRDAEVVRGRIEREAREEAERMLARAKRDIEIARDTAVSDLYKVAASLATDVAGRIIRKEMSAVDHEALVKESIEELALTGRR